MSALAKSARAHRAEYRIQLVGLIVILAACTLTAALLVIRFRLGLS